MTLLIGDESAFLPGRSRRSWAQEEGSYPRPPAPPSHGRSQLMFLNRKPLYRCDMEELAAHQVSAQARSGVAFARNADGEEKQAARQRVLDLFSLHQWPSRLHFLTMPGVQWRFERRLLGLREVGWLRKPKPSTTYFTSCESDRSVFHAAVAQMPGLHTTNSKLKRVKPFPFAEMGVKTRYATLFFANVDDFMAAEWNDGWDAAWLDYTGPLNVERLALIKRFYLSHVRHVLIVTSLKSRYSSSTIRAIHQAGGHSEWMRHSLKGEVLHDIEYFDTSAMHQFAVQRVRWQSPLA